MIKRAYFIYYPGCGYISKSTTLIALWSYSTQPFPAKIINIDMKDENKLS